MEAQQGEEVANGVAMEHSGTDHAKAGEEDDRKLFIGGLSWETTEDNLKDFFSKYGEIENVNLKTDPNTGRSRGFAFVVFKAVDSVENVLNAGDLTIQSKKVEAKRAKARQGKVFVGGLPAELSEDEIKAHFGSFGKIAQMEMPFDKVRNQRKGFCFITFENESAMKELLRNPKQTLGGKEVDVKKATPRNDQMGFGGGPGFMRGGPRGAPRGGMMRGGVRGAPRGGPRGGGWGGAAGNGGGWGGQQWNQGYGDGYSDGGYGYGGYGGGGGGGGGNGGYGGYGYSGYDNSSYGGGYGNQAGGGGYEGYGQAAGGGGVRGAPRGAGRGGPRGAGRYQPY